MKTLDGPLSPRCPGSHAPDPADLYEYSPNKGNENDYGGKMMPHPDPHHNPGSHGPNKY